MGAWQQFLCFTRNQKQRTMNGFSVLMGAACVCVFYRESKSKKDDEEDPDWGSLKPGEALLACRGAVGKRLLPAWECIRGRNLWACQRDITSVLLSTIFYFSFCFCVLQLLHALDFLSWDIDTDSIILFCFVLFPEKLISFHWRCPSVEFIAGFWIPFFIFVVFW